MAIYLFYNTTTEYITELTIMIFGTSKKSVIDLWQEIHIFVIGKWFVQICYIDMENKIWCFHWNDIAGRRRRKRRKKKKEEEEEEEKNDDDDGGGGGGGGGDDDDDNNKISYWI